MTDLQQGRLEKSPRREVSCRLSEDLIIADNATNIVGNAWPAATVFPAPERDRAVRKQESCEGEDGNENGTENRELQVTARNELFASSFRQTPVVLLFLGGSFPGNFFPSLT